MATLSMINSNSHMDKLTSEIFSILENKFLFGYDNNNNNNVTSPTKDQLSVPIDEMKFHKHVSGKVRVLSIDGGGATDGVLAATSIVHLESSLRRSSGIPDARISDFFDVVTGSGIGGVLAALLFTKGKDGEPLFTADDALRFVVENGCKMSRFCKPGVFRRILGNPPKSGKVFSKTFGDLSLKDTVKAVLIPCYDLTTGAPFVFSRADAVEMEGCDFKMSDVCAATTAVNGPVETVSVDRRTKISAVTGELAMNNPTAMAITHILNNKQEFPFCNTVDDLLVVSLGNGEPSCGVAGNQTPSRAALLKIVGETVSDTVDQAISMAFGQSRASNYGRIQGNKGFVDSGNLNKGKETNMLKLAEQMLRQKNVESVLFQGKKCNKTNLDKLEFFATEIVKETERRKLNILPTVVLRQTTTSSSPRTSSATTLSITSSN
ncbi:putative patatin-like phospholipase domain, Acyl transferase/acyl hydrolase/lysophospholipase [Helianthus annuus]|nr:putative patatin-like phospholipase domain, Acyl transferase/acyl hydrolase/lysophospholipase [Helianthus annuus]